MDLLQKQIYNLNFNFKLKKVMAKMTKSQLVAALAEKTELSKKVSADVLELLAEMAYTEVKKNGD